MLTVGTISGLHCQIGALHGAISPVMDLHGQKQVDILISKNQALQILYLKHITLHKLPWIETHENLISTKLNIYTVQFYYYITIVNKTYLIIGQQVISKFFNSSICVI